jgi:hypothetical protein
VDARDGAAERAARAIDDVRDSGDLTDSWWDDWGAEVVGTITKIADIVATVAGVLALVVAFIPVVGQALAAVLGTIALVASLVSLAGHIALAATGQEGWTETAWAAVGVLSFGVGRAATAGLRVSAAGVRGASRLAAGRLAATSSGLARAGTTSARTAIARMLGESSFADVLGRGAARTASAASRAQGAVPSLADTFSDLRGIGGEFRSGLRTVFTGSSWSAAASSSLPRGLDGAISSMWGPDVADALAAIGRTDSSVLRTGEVLPHLAATGAQAATRAVADLVGASSTGRSAAQAVGDVYSALFVDPPPPVYGDADAELVGAR